ncbi:GlxA family transcriptional regulator [Paraburkholderia phosphatilytica]|uniref:GlxA family transcriptional regulator n=1 Tax=Paraburkholderia phosphatilytica TaxID=2282883 RepID=UPI000E547DCB|nr:AraC family transcriptional regulator [Paraburkholderia phosphatilytica]
MRIAIMLYAGFQLLDVSGPMDVFQEANRLYGATFYEQQLVGPSHGPVMCSNGTAVSTTASLRDARASFDIVVVPGAPLVAAEHEHRELVDWLSRTGRNARKLASVSNGAFLVARAGLADHRWMITHGRDAQRLASEYPLVNVTTDLNCLKDGNLYSSDGVSAGIHLALTLVEEDLGEHAVRRIASALLM